jgi:hypothetical protein
VSIECGECEHDLRGGHDDACSRAKKCDACGTVVSWRNVTPDGRREGLARICQCGNCRVWEDE